MYRILVVMSTYNGERYIKEQIDSIFNQQGVYCDLLIRDDGSADSTVKIIKDYQKKYSNRIDLVNGNNIGFAKSFWSLLQIAKDNYDFYAFSDQDDVWMDKKLIRACDMLDNCKDDSNYLLYASAMDVVDEKLNHMYYQTFNDLKIGFGSALTRQRLAGCTMVFNNKLFNYVKKHDLSNTDLFTHDMMLYYLCILIGGRVLYDDCPSIYFRRSSDSLTLQGKSIIKKANSIFSIFSKDKNIRFRKVEYLYNLISAEISPKIIDEFQTILNYKDSIRNTIRLATSDYIKCQIKSVDAVYFFAILLRFY